MTMVGVVLTPYRSWFAAVVSTGSVFRNGDLGDRRSIWSSING